MTSTSFVLPSTLTVNLPSFSVRCLRDTFASDRAPCVVSLQGCRLQQRLFQSTCGVFLRKTAFSSWQLTLDMLISSGPTFIASSSPREHTPKTKHIFIIDDILSNFDTTYRQIPQKVTKRNVLIFRSAYMLDLNQGQSPTSTRLRKKSLLLSVYITCLIVYTVKSMHTYCSFSTESIQTLSESSKYTQKLQYKVFWFVIQRYKTVFPKYASIHMQAPPILTGFQCCTITTSSVT